MNRPLVGILVGMGAFALGVGAMAAVNVLTETPPAEPTASATPSASPSESPSPSPSPTPSASPTPSPSPTVSPTPYFSKHTYLLDTPVSPWVVVNKIRPLEPQDYVPPELVKLTEIPGGGDQQLIPEAATALVALHAAAKDADAGFSVSTAYRSYNQQKGIFNSYVNEWGRTKAETFAARAGYSEHQTGRAVDIFTSAACKLKACFADTAAAQFVAQHAHEYGFIVRYPDAKQDITGYRYEPWHLRYVGVELATQMYTVGPYTMEEFFELKAAPDYLE